MKKWLSLLILLIAVIYRDSFISPFFQDDKILLNLFFWPTANFPYRPISQALFYHVSYFLFGLNPLGFHLIIFIFFAGTVILIFELAKYFLHDENKAMVATFFYALNISLFANFYWIATSYFTIGAFFFFLTIHFYTKKKWLFTAGAFLLAFGSNEMALVLPVIFLMINWLENSWPKWWWVFLVSLPILFWLRILIGFPQANDYTLAFDGRVIATFRWYLIRTLNLPEGVLRIL